MSPSTQQILASAMALPEGERLELAELLFSASEPPAPALAGDAWSEEIDRRSAEFDTESTTYLPWPEVKQRARDQHGS